MAQIEDLDNKDISKMSSDELRAYLRDVRAGRRQGREARARKASAKPKAKAKTKKLDISKLSPEEAAALLEQLKGGGE